jgi:hypothetical protein
MKPDYMKEIRDQPQPTGARTAIKRILLEQPDLSVEEIEQELRRQGYELTKVAIQSIRKDFRATLKLLKSEGIDLNRRRRSTSARREKPIKLSSTSQYLVYTDFYLVPPADHSNEQQHDLLA